MDMNTSQVYKWTRGEKMDTEHRSLQTEVDRQIQRGGHNDTGGQKDTDRWTYKKRTDRPRKADG